VPLAENAIKLFTLAIERQKTGANPDENYFPEDLSIKIS
jgi:hypothetical protein